METTNMQLFVANTDRKSQSTLILVKNTIEQSLGTKLSSSLLVCYPLTVASCHSIALVFPTAVKLPWHATIPPSIKNPCHSGSWFSLAVFAKFDLKTDLVPEKDSFLARLSISYKLVIMLSVCVSVCVCVWMLTRVEQIVAAAHRDL